MQFNRHAVWAIYQHEMIRFFHTINQSLASPVISTSLYFIVFGTAIGSRIQQINGIPYGEFIVPGMLMFALLTQSISNAAFGIFFQKFTGAIYEILSSPISSFEVLMGFVGAAASKSFIIGTIILITANFFVDLHIIHPWMALLFLILVCITFSLLGFIIGIMSKNFEQLQIVPLLVVTPLVFLGGSFYSINMLPEFWQNVSMFNPVLYLISGLRFSFFEVSDVDIVTSLIVISAVMFVCLAWVWWIFHTGYKIRN